MKSVYISLFIVCFFIANASFSQLTFIKNEGQVHDQFHAERPDVLFSGESKGLTIHFKRDGFSYQMVRSSGEKIIIHRIDVHFLGVNDHVQVAGKSRRNEYMNYYTGPEEEGITHVPVFNEVIYEDIYRGIDLRIYQNRGSMEYDFIVKKGSDPTFIQWTISGQDEAKVNQDGELVMSDEFGDIVEHKPIAFQDQKSIQANWKIINNRISFELGEYDPTKDLIIDPLVGLRSWATYYGASLNDEGMATDVDAAGNVYMGGYTYSATSIATSGSHQSTMSGGQDAFLAKFSPNGSRLWATYYGGTSSDVLTDLAAQGSSFVYLTGYTNSSNMATSGSHQNGKAASFDAFLAKFNSSGVRQWSTYYGGNSTDYAEGLCVDDSTLIYLVGRTMSTDSIATTGSHNDTLNGQQDGFLVQFNNQGVRQWATYIGGPGLDHLTSCTVDGSNTVVLGGYSESTSGISTTGIHQSSNAGLADAVVIKFNGGGIRQWGTYYGGSGEDLGQDVELDAMGNIYLTGTTRSTSGISTSGTHQTVHGGGADDGFIAKLNASGNRIWATYYGGMASDEFFSSALSGTEGLFAYGKTNSIANIATPGSYQSVNNGVGDAYLVKIDTGGQRVWATYFGGSSLESIGDCASAGPGLVYICGQTSSSSNISSPNAHQDSIGGSYDAFLAKFMEGNCVADSTFISDTSCGSYTSPSGKYTWSVSGIYVDTFLNSIGCDSLIYVDLMVSNDSMFAVDLSACNASNYVSPSGKYLWSSPGNYKDTLASAFGCDSILDIQLSFVSIDTSLFRSGDSLYSAELYGDQYTWYDCPINLGALGIGRSISPPLLVNNMSYWVEIKKGACVVFSECHLASGVGMENWLKDEIEIRPNPSRGKFRVHNIPPSLSTQIQVRSIQGQLVHQVALNGRKSIDFSLEVDAGIYFIVLIGNHDVFRQRLVIE